MNTAQAEVLKIAAIWSARKARGRRLLFYPTIGAASQRGSLVGVLLPGVPNEDSVGLRSPIGSRWRKGGGRPGLAFCQCGSYLPPMFWRSPAPARRPAGFIELCLPAPADIVPSGPQWVHEIKHSGYRFICRREGNRIRVFSRCGHGLAGQVPRVMDTSARRPANSVTLDSEGVACGTSGVTDFELLSVALDGHAKREVFRYTFDLVELDGRDLRREPWSDRRSKLARLLRGSGHRGRLSDRVEGNDGEAMFRRACLIKPRRRRREAARQAFMGRGDR